MASPHPKPTRLKILEGNPGKRPLPENEPMPDVPDKVPNAPRHLSKEAKKEWANMSKKLHRLGLLTNIDTTALALYCQAYGRWVEAELNIQLLGATITTINGNIIQSPHVGMANMAMRDCHKFLSDFGMTPSSRAKVTSAKKAEKSKFSGLIGAKKTKKVG